MTKANTVPHADELDDDDPCPWEGHASLEDIRNELIDIGRTLFVIGALLLALFVMAVLR